MARSEDRESRAEGGNGAAGPRQRAGFREEHDRLVVANSAFGLAFSTIANGTLVSIHNRETQTEFVHADEAAADGHLWRIVVETRDGSATAVTNRTAQSFSHTVAHEQDGSVVLRLRWKGLRARQGEIEGEVVADWLFPAQGATAVSGLGVRLPSQLVVRAVEYPCLCSLGTSDPRAEESLFLPLSEGLLIPEPRGLLVPGEDNRWKASYPGEASIQLMGYSCGGGGPRSSGSAAEEATVALACRDATGKQKEFVATGMPRSNRLALLVAQAPGLCAEGTWGPGYPLTVSVVTGDWLEAAREYRAWAIEQAWCSRGRGGMRNLPPRTAAPGLWVSFWGGPRAVLTVTRDLQRLVAAPLKLDWRCWHGCVRDGAYPDYLPPREGERVFAEAAAQLAGAAILTQLGFNGLLASPESQTWQADQGEQYRVRNEETVPAAPEEEAVRPVPMCPSTPYWQQTLARIARATVALGASGVYVEDLVKTPPLACQAGDHGHPAGDQEHWLRGVRMALQSLREVCRAGDSGSAQRSHLAADGPAEHCLDLVDVTFTSDCTAERNGLFLGGGGGVGMGAPALQRAVRWTPIPLFSAVYHSYCTLVSYGISLGNNQPYDPQWPAETIAALHEPEDLMGRDLSPQFYLETARSIVAGEQLMITNLTQRQARDQIGRRKLAFVRSALQAQAWGVGKLLPFSEFMGLLAVEAAPIDVEMLVNPPGSAPEGRYTLRRRQVPVLGSMWQTPGSGGAVVLVNIHDEPVEFAAPLRPARLGLSAGSRKALDLAGRTFTPDSEAPAAGLHASPSEISGRLPPRSVFLLQVR